MKVLKSLVVDIIEGILNGKGHIVVVYYVAIAEDFLYVSNVDYVFVANVLENF